MAEFIPTGIGGFTRSRTRPATRKVTPDKTGARGYERHELLPPPRPQRDFVPSEEVIGELVNRALAALARGIRWDRGSIINLVL